MFAVHRALKDTHEFLVLKKVSVHSSKVRMALGKCHTHKSINVTMTGITPRRKPTPNYLGEVAI